MLRDPHRERPIVDRAEESLEVVAYHLVERRGLGLMAAIDADFAFRVFEGEAASVALACNGWGPRGVLESAG